MLSQVLHRTVILYWWCLLGCAPIFGTLFWSYFAFQRGRKYKQDKGCQYRAGTNTKTSLRQALAIQQYNETSSLVPILTQVFYSKLFYFMTACLLCTGCRALFVGTWALIAHCPTKKPGNCRNTFSIYIIFVDSYFLHTNEVQSHC